MESTWDACVRVRDSTSRQGQGQRDERCDSAASVENFTLEIVLEMFQ